MQRSLLLEPGSSALALEKGMAQTHLLSNREGQSADADSNSGAPLETSGSFQNDSSIMKEPSEIKEMVEIYEEKGMSHEDAKLVIGR